MITYETAILLKEAGWDIPTIAFYNRAGKIEYSTIRPVDWNLMTGNMVSAPTADQIWEVLEEVVFSVERVFDNGYLVIGHYGIGLDGVTGETLSEALANAYIQWKKKSTKE